MSSRIVFREARVASDDVLGAGMNKQGNFTCCEPKVLHCVLNKKGCNITLYVKVKTFSFMGILIP